jgi:hypothetical protein
VIQQVDSALREWCAAALRRLDVPASVAVSLGPPERAPAAPHVGLHLLDVRPGSPRLNSRRPAVEILLRYLVTVHNADDPGAAHRILGELLLSALEDPSPTDGGLREAGLRMEIETGALQAADWLAFGVPPRPAFLLRVPLRRERPLPDAPAVTEDIDVGWRALRRLAGTVLGPGDTPLNGAEVQLPALGLVARTDASGRFSMPAIPGGPGEVHLHVLFNGRESQLAATPGRPLVVRLAAEKVNGAGGTAEATLSGGGGDAARDPADAADAPPPPRRRARTRRARAADEAET